jgi:hypothetical protein
VAQSNFSSPTCHNIGIISIMVLNHDRRLRLLRLLLVVLLCCYHNSIRLRHRLTRPAIVSPRESPWQKLYKYADIRNPEMFNRNHSVITILFTELISVV